MSLHRTAQCRHGQIVFLLFSENAQKLYVRLFGRVHRWLRQSKIVYPAIADELSNVLDELVSSELLLNGE